MFATLLLAAAVTGMQAPAPAAAPATTQANAGKLFISPMGEPFYGRVAGEDGLVVWFQQADANHDGYLTSEEMKADADRFFKVLDRNGDGEIDPDDISYYETNLAPQLRVSATVTRTNIDGDTVEYADSETTAGQLGLLQIPQPVTSADRDFNRGVSVEEFRTAATRRFQMLDNAGTGRLSLPQLVEIRRAAMAASKRRHAPARAADFKDNLAPQ